MIKAIQFVKTVVATVFTVSFLSFIQGCSVRKSEPISGPLKTNNERVLNGQVVFMQNCHKCHPAGEAGLGPTLLGSPAPQFLMRFQVRHGLGVMPSFKPDQISRKDLHDISKYLKAMKKK